MRTKILIAGFLISLASIISFWASSSIWIFDVRAVEDGARVFCAEVAPQDEIVYASINSIFSDLVEEHWQVQHDGKLRVVQVVSSPAVMGYYGIESYAPLDAGRVRAVPKDVVYEEIRMKVGARGEARLIVREREVALYRLLPEAAVVTIRVYPVMRWRGCW
ncbi:MAG: hypothetical protein HY782_19745 [Chloroflexi bacterium]|nr:hypothetical protein [Chloroflexota bacterium]